MVAVNNLRRNTSEDKIYCHTGGKARWVGFPSCVGLGDALCPTGGCAGKRGWLVWIGLCSRLPRFPSWQADSVIIRAGSGGEYVVWSVEEWDMY